MGLSCEEIADVLPAWDGVNCGAAHEKVRTLVDSKRSEVADRIRELEGFAAQLDEVRAALDGAPPPTECRADLSCCVPDTGAEVTLITSMPTPRRRR
jgi:DNA-binding transcriptional MerR regulator